MNCPFVPLQQFRDNPESEPRAGLWFCRKEGLVDVLQGFTVDSLAVIADGNAHPADVAISPLMRGAKSDHDSSVFLNRLNRIRDEIREDLLRLAWHARHGKLTLRIH